MLPVAPSKPRSLHFAEVTGPHKPPGVIITIKQTRHLEVPPAQAVTGTIGDT